MSCTCQECGKKYKVDLKYLMNYGIKLVQNLMVLVCYVVVVL